MTTQPEALRLADELATAEADVSLMDCAFWVKIGPSTLDEAAAELRRLHAENEALRNIKHYEAPRGFVLNPDYLVPELRAQRNALLEALRGLLSYANVLEMRLLAADGEHPAMQQARAAIATVEGEKA